MSRAIQLPHRTTCQPYGRQQHFLVQFCVCFAMHSFDRRRETCLYVCCGREDLRIDQPNCIEQRRTSILNNTQFPVSQLQLIANIFYVDLNQLPLCNFCQLIIPLDSSHISCRRLRTIESLFFVSGCDSRSKKVVLFHNRILVFLKEGVRDDVESVYILSHAYLYNKRLQLRITMKYLMLNTSP